MTPRPSTLRPETHCLSGWGESTHGRARVWRPTSTEEVQDLLQRFAAEGRRVCVRGSGRSYGDAALLGGKDVLDLRRMNGIRSFDREQGVIDCEAGVSIEDLCRAVIGAGWWPAVVPGTMVPTVGGCVAMNVHGKNQFRVGNFGEHIEELEFVTPAGEVRRLAPDCDPELFRAVVGGMGLLGVVTSVRLRLKRAHSGRLRVKALATRTLAEMVREFDVWEDVASYLVGWIDCFHRTDRGVVHVGFELGPGEDPEAARWLDPVAQEVPERLFGVLPRGLVSPLLLPFGRPLGMRLINQAKYLSAWADGTATFLQSFGAFSFLLDYVPAWKRIYDPGGLVQYQTFVPKEHTVAVHGEILARCREAGLVSWLGVFKRHRPDACLLSHTLDGHSLALDFPVTPDNRGRLWELCHDLDEIVLAAGGRFYFAKDSTATPEAAEVAYPGLAEFRRLKQQLDPGGLLTSDLARRLGIVAR